jgi:hypothetical protein
MARPIQIAARILVWFVGGAILFLAMRWTAQLLPGPFPARGPRWWIGGLVFIAIELIVHIVLQLRRVPSFYNGRG